VCGQEMTGNKVGEDESTQCQCGLCDRHNDVILTPCSLLHPYGTIATLQ
jgi:hypothetical protein